MDIENFEEFYILQLQRLLDAEQQLSQALPNMAAAAQSEDLRDAFQFHHGQTRAQAKRLEKILAGMGEDGKSEDCEVTQALIDETDDLIAAIEDSPLRDIALIGAGNKIEHFEMAAYGIVRSLAQKLGHVSAVELLERSLAEEVSESEKLTQVGHAIL